MENTVSILEIAGLKDYCMFVTMPMPTPSTMKISTILKFQQKLVKIIQKPFTMMTMEEIKWIENFMEEGIFKNCILIW